MDMRIKTRAIFSYGAVFFFLGSCLLWQCNNTPTETNVDRHFIVSAGTDDTVRLNEEVYLAGSASEDGVLDTAFIFSWKQISGPDTVRFFSPLSQYTKVTFRKTGIYQLSLTVSDGTISKSDIVIYSVLDSIPFMVLEPAAGDRIVIGDSVLITWQIVTPFTQTMIDLSIDKGKTWIILTDLSVQNDTKWVWHVDRNLAPCDSCMVKIRDYNNSSIIAKSQYFSLIQLQKDAKPVMSPRASRGRKIDQGLKVRAGSADVESPALHDATDKPFLLTQFVKT
jgi:hypothetical protein